MFVVLSHHVWWLPVTAVLVIYHFGHTIYREVQQNLTHFLSLSLSLSLSHTHTHTHTHTKGLLTGDFKSIDNLFLEMVRMLAARNCEVSGAVNYDGQSLTL